MKLGAFSISLNVSNLSVSRDFYAALGFKPVGGNEDQGWLILRNDTTTIGLFNGMFEGNLMTFNPGWDAEGEPLNTFDDIRDIQRSLVSQDIKLESVADEATTGPASLMLADPDGNMILIDQHV